MFRIWPTRSRAKIIDFPATLTFDYIGCMRLCISIASILLVTTPAVAAVITVREQTPDRPSVVVVALAAFDEDQFAIKAASLSSAFIAFK